MPSRTVRRYRHKHLARIEALTAEEKTHRATQLLMLWRAEARRRARSLGAPAVWDLARDPYNRELTRRLDPTGGLQADLDRVCAEAVAEFAGQHLVRVRRPPTGQARGETPPPEQNGDTDHAMADRVAIRSANITP